MAMIPQKMESNSVKEIDLSQYQPLKTSRTQRKAHDGLENLILDWSNKDRLATTSEQHVSMRCDVVDIHSDFLRYMQVTCDTACGVLIRTTH